MACVLSRVDMWVNSVGRVTYSEPLEASVPRFTGGTGPEPLPNTASRPKGRRQSIEPSKVSLPTESYTTFTPLPPVISFTRAAKFSVL
ncbi:Uncharacterised protein [Mycobacterium tuberculosis]|nr:Uncharacterised protein [Mycobacterium tuberculosis]